MTERIIYRQEGGSGGAYCVIDLKKSIFWLPASFIVYRRGFESKVRRLIDSLFIDRLAGSVVLCTSPDARSIFDGIKSNRLNVLDSFITDDILFGNPLMHSVLGLNAGVLTAGLFMLFDYLQTGNVSNFVMPVSIVAGPYLARRLLEPHKALEDKHVLLVHASGTKLPTFFKFTQPSVAGSINTMEREIT